MIKFTDLDGNTLYANPDHVVYLVAGDDHRPWQIQFSRRGCIPISEAVAQDICQQMNEYLNPVVELEDDWSPEEN